MLLFEALLSFLIEELRFVIATGFAGSPEAEPVVVVFALYLGDSFLGCSLLTWYLGNSLAAGKVCLLFSPIVVILGMPDSLYPVLFIAFES